MPEGPPRFQGLDSWGIDWPSSQAQASSDYVDPLVIGSSDVGGVFAQDEIDAKHVSEARRAYRRFGKGRDATGFNFGDVWSLTRWPARRASSEIDLPEVEKICACGSTVFGVLLGAGVAAHG